MICDEAHTALGEKTSAAIRSLSEPIYIGMTATEELIAKQVSDVFPASVDDLPLADAARRGLIAPLRCLRVPPVAAINSVPIVGGDFEERALAAALDHEALNMAAATLYRERFDDTPGIVYAAGVDHAYNLATAFRAAGVKAEAVSGRTPPVKLAAILAAYERGEIDVLINAMLLAEGWNSPRATVVMHLAPTASKRVYQQRIGRIMRIHPRKEAGIVVDFVPKGATHNERVVSLHSLLDADFYREGARVTPAPRRRTQRRARRKLTPATWLVPVTPDVARRLAVIQREWQRVDPKYLDDDEQRFWATIAGRQMRFDERQAFVQKFTERGASKGALETFLSTCAAQNPNRRLRLIALADRVSMRVERADFDDLVTLVTQAPPWEKDRAAGVRILLRAIAEGKPDAPGSDPRALDVAARARGAQDARPQGVAGVPGRQAAARRARELARATGTRRTRRGSSRRRSRCRARSARRCSRPPRATRRARRSCSRRPASGSARSRRSPRALADDLPAPKTGPSRSRRRRRRKKKPGEQRRRGRRRRRRPKEPASRRRTATLRQAAAAPLAGAAAASRPRRPTLPPGLSPKTPGADGFRHALSTSELSVRDRTSALPSHVLVLLGIGFLAGSVTAISPCVLPVLPILLAGGASGRKPLRIVTGLVASFVVFTLFATWLLDKLGLPDDLLRNLAIALLFLVAATLLVPRLATLARAAVRPAHALPRGRRRLPARRLARARLRARAPGPVLAAITIVAATNHVGVAARSRSRSPTRSAPRCRCC